jgi:predicted nucleotidyltransferase
MPGAAALLRGGSQVERRDNSNRKGALYNCRSDAYTSRQTGRPPPHAESLEMLGETSSQLPRTEGLTPTAARALELFERDARRSYGDDLLKIVLFGSRARGDAGPDSDIDVAVVLKDIRDRGSERNRLADIAYDAITETYVDVQALPISGEEWEHPDVHRNPALIRAIKRDGVVLEGRNDQQKPQQSSQIR